MTPIPQINAIPFQAPTRDAALLDAAKKLEATFLAEMLKAAGFGEARDTFGGGEGEDQFASFLVQEQATAMGRVAWIRCGAERALPETEFRRCVRNWDGQVRSSD
jgi:flagellar protein FlgJ